MNKRNKLLPYLEGTLPSEERLRVRNKLLESERLQTELTQTQYVHEDLQRELPLMGRSGQERIQALLPDILARAQRSRRDIEEQRYRLPMIFLLCLATGVFVLPFLLITSSSQAADNALQNVPRATDSVTVPEEETVEAAVQSSDDDSNKGNASNRQQHTHGLIETQTGQNARMASPVPAPRNTLEPSAEALVAYR